MLEKIHSVACFVFVFGRFVSKTVKRVFFKKSTQLVESRCFVLQAVWAVLAVDRLWRALEIAFASLQVGGGEGILMDVNGVQSRSFPEHRHDSF